MQKNLDNYIFITVQPYDYYFTWQVEIQIVNFRKHGISDKMHVLVWYPKGKDKNGKTGEWNVLQRKYPEVSFFFYEDSEKTNIGLYIPLLRPDALMQHFQKYPELSKKTIFYHDCDIIFNYLPDFERLAGDDINWQSNTSSYLGYEYLVNKEVQGNIPDNEIVKTMADIGGITPEIIESYAHNTGGAQYVLKDIDASFWRDVKTIAEEIRKRFYFKSENSINRKYFKSENEGLQSWCADMWAVNFSLWKRGKKTNTTDELAFSWATDSADIYLIKPIYHNAGVTSSNTELFYKGKWMLESPIGKKISVKKNTASWYYVQAMKEVK